MDEVDQSVLFEVEPHAATHAYDAFEAWAGSEAITVLFTPEPLMAVDRPGRRGFLYDETYFITVWASVGGEELLAIVRAASSDAEPPILTMQPTDHEPNPLQTLALVLDAGLPLTQVRHLL